MNEAMRDVFGREIQIGDTIAYAGTAGRSAELRFYRVEALKPDVVTCRQFLKGWKRHWAKDTIVDSDYSNRRVGLSDSKRMMVVPSEYLDLVDKSK